MEQTDVTPSCPSAKRHRIRTPLSVRRGLALCACLCVCVMTTEVRGQSAALTLAWDPNTEPDVAGYVVHVGTEPGSYTKTYDVGKETSFVYRDAQSGRRYYFAVAAYAPGPTFSPVSAEVWAVAGWPAQTFTAGGVLPDQTDVPATTKTQANGRESRRVCAEGQPASCLEREQVASGLGEIRSLVNAGDDEVLFIERERYVRALAGGTLRPEPLLTADADVRLSGLAVDPLFAQTRFVFVAEIETMPDGGRELNIARYRLVQLVFGERAVVVAGLTLDSDSAVPFEIDSAGRLHLAMPSAASAGSRNAYAGMVVRFNSDGTVPRDSRASSPIIAYGYGHPTALKVDDAGQRLWLSGTDAAWPQSLASLELRGLDSGEWPKAPRGIDVGGAFVSGAPRISALEVAGARAPDGEALFLVGGEALARIRWQGDEAPSLTSWSVAEYGTPVALVANASGSLYVAFQSAGTGASLARAFTIEKLQLP